MLNCFYYLKWRHKCKITVIGGDGTGPEVVEEGLKTLKVINEQFKIKASFIPMDINGERYKRTGRY